MAKTVSDIFLRLKLDGKEQLEKLKGSFRGLEKTIGITDSALEQIRSELVAYNREGGASIAVLKAQVSALGDLQKQATAGGKVFRQLSRDVEAFERRLRQAESQAKATERAVSFRATQGRFISATPGGLFGKVAALQQAPQAERFIEGKGINPEYLRQQGELKVLLEAQTRIEARLQNAINATTKAKVDNNNESLTAAQITEKYSKGIDTSANTTAQLSQRIRELRSDLRDLTFGSREYGRVLAQINRLEGEIADPFGTSARKEQIRGRLGTQQQFGMFVGTDPVAKSIRRQQAKQARRAGPRQVPAQIREISGLYEQIGGIGMQGVRADIEMMGNSYQKVAGDIKAATAASNGSINSLQAQRGAWVTLRGNLDPASKAYREVGKEITRVEKRLDRLTNKQKLSARIRGNLGAAAAGAVFGGPEAAVGGLVGGIPGAAIGAQAAMLRQNLSGTAEYAAEVNKLRIALAGVTQTAGANADALAAINDVVRDFNVPQEVATRGMTRLSAAVLGAGGNVADAELVFKNITASIKATGGSADDVNSAITAMVQVFSKGKVSAEELSGQLGERLPGAVTKFAEANFEGDMIALQKALKDGTVGLNELMEFVKELGVEYTGTAKQIAASSVDAGARATVAMNDLKLAVGEAIQPIGAELQAAFAEFALEVLPQLIEASKLAAKAFDLLLKVAGEVIKNFKELMIVAGVAGVGLALSNLVTIASTLGTVVGALQVKFAALNLTMLANPWVALGAGIAAAAVALYRAATANDKFRESLEKGKITLDEGKKKIQETQQKIDQLQERLNKTSNNRLISSLRRQIADAKGELDAFNRSLEIGIYREFGGGKGFVGPVLPGTSFADEQRNAQLTKFKPLTGEDSDGEKKKLMTKAEADLRIRIIQLRNQELQLQAIQAQYELDVLVANQETEDLQKRRVALEEARIARLDAVKNLMKGIGTEAIKQRKELESFNKELADRKFQLGLIGEEEYNRLLIERERARLKEAYPDLDPFRREEMVDLKRQEIDPTLMQQMEQNIARLKREMDDLLNPVNRIVDAAGAIGKAFTDSFTSVISGSATTREALAGFFKNVANYFLDMAGQIIAKMIQMAILNSIVSVLPSAAGGISAGSSANAPAFQPTLVAGKGFAFDKGVKRYAMGGIVNKPTLFTYADGGTGRFGLMGEAGPEAILPLKRGSDGKLGVASTKSVGNIVVNVDASGSSVEGNDTESKRLGEAIGVAIRQELIKQKRPGGLLA